MVLFIGEKKNLKQKKKPNLNNRAGKKFVIKPPEILRKIKMLLKAELLV
jgi:hypothetical protein